LGKSYVFSFKLPEVNTGKVYLWIIWFRIKVVPDITITLTPFATKASCPTISLLKNLKPVYTWEPYEEGESFGVQSKMGLEGDNLKILVGAKIGVTIRGASYWWRVFNSTIDKGVYADISGEMQYLVTAPATGRQPFLSKVVRKIRSLGLPPCVCVNIKVKADVKADIGLNPGAAGILAGGLAGALVAAPVLVPIAPFAYKVKDLIYGAP
jgi:hypothetical protein